eukprot:scaffold651389_cov51-Prasinocladus_malaysianus.AAC.1
MIQELFLEGIAGRSARHLDAGNRTQLQYDDVGRIKALPLLESFLTFRYHRGSLHGALTCWI